MSKKCQKMDMKIYGNVTVGPKGQIVIPKDVRDQIGINTGDSLVVIIKGGIAVGLIKNENMGGVLEYINREIGS